MCTVLHVNFYSQREREIDRRVKEKREEKLEQGKMQRDRESSVLFLFIGSVYVN